MSQIVVFLMLALLASGCLFDSSKKKKASATQKLNKCFTDRGCATGCGSLAHFQSLQNQLMSSANGGVGNALGSLSQQDQTCYLCGAPCLQAAAVAASTGANLRKCGDGTHLMPGLLQPTVPSDCIPNYVPYQQAPPPPGYIYNGQGYQQQPNYQGGTPQNVQLPPPGSM